VPQPIPVGPQLWPVLEQGLQFAAVLIGRLTIEHGHHQDMSPVSSIWSLEVTDCPPGPRPAGVVPKKGSSPKLMAEAREQAIDRMVAQAMARGANAVINVRFSTSYIMGSASEILAYGEAVTVEKA
jgi:hypothetical protein